jgi:cyclic pyranopterin phosphate synthase
VARVNVSLDTLRAATFREITGRDGLGRVLSGIRAAREAGLGVKINVVAMRGVNDGEFRDFVAFGIENGFAVRFIELMPQRYNSGFARELFVSAGEIRDALVGAFRLDPRDVEGGDAASGFYKATERTGGRRGENPGRSAVVGMISPLSDPFCRRCNRVRLTADGTLKSCLFGEGGPNLRELLETGAPTEEIETAILGVVRTKPKSLRHGSPCGNVMHATGG